MQPKIKVTMAWPMDIHRAATELARRNRRSFTAEATVALDEHLQHAGVTLTPTAAPTTENPQMEN